MTHFDYSRKTSVRKRLGLIVLQEDERIESDFQALLYQYVDVFFSRIASSKIITAETLMAMETHLVDAASLLPSSTPFDAIGYGCTSASAQIGSTRIAQLIGLARQCHFITNPLNALTSACKNQNINSLALLSPYVQSVSEGLRAALQHHGIATPIFGSYDEERESQVARISPQSIHDAALALGKRGGVDGVFLSCTNLNTLSIIAPLQDALGLPVFSSNLVLAWDMLRGARCDDLPQTPSALLERCYAKGIRPI